jgi:hypothetical protein
MSTSTDDTAKSDALLTEYNALRSELVSRIGIRNQIFLGALTLAGVTFSFGLSNPSIAFVCPIIAMCLGAAWLQHDARVREIGEYIREQIEPNVPGLGWEVHRRQRKVKSTRVGGMRLTTLSAGGVFIVIQIMAILIGASKISAFTLSEWLFGAVAVACTFVTTLLLGMSRRR